MSVTRDRLNARALLGLLGRSGVPTELPQPLLIAAAGAGGEGGSAPAGPWAETVTIGTELSAGQVYYPAGGSWLGVDQTIGSLVRPALCLTASDDPASSTLLVAGMLARSGTAGAGLYVSSTGTVTETNPGDAEDETTTAPWVWCLGWQLTADLAIFLPEPAYRPREIRYCLPDGETQITLLMREYGG